LQELGRKTVSDVGGTFQRRKVRIAEVNVGKETIGSQIAFIAVIVLSFLLILLFAGWRWIGVWF
jgi:hypothetical protein